MSSFHHFRKQNWYLYNFVWIVNTLRPRQNGRHFADDIFKWIFLNENVWILIKTSLKFVPQGPINNIPALVQIMAWCRPGDKLLSEPMVVSLPTHICVTRPQWVNRTCVTLLLKIYRLICTKHYIKLNWNISLNKLRTTKNGHQHTVCSVSMLIYYLSTQDPMNVTLCNDSIIFGWCNYHCHLLSTIVSQ